MFVGCCSLLVDRCGARVYRALCMLRGSLCVVCCLLFMDCYFVDCCWLIVMC